MKTKQIQLMKNLFSKVDVFVTPTTGLPPPEITLDMLKYGSSDLTTSGAVMRFITLANFTGVPAISCPVGYTAEKGLPIGIQFTGKWWSEALLLKIAHASELLFTSRKQPQIHFDLLESSK